MRTAIKSLIRKSLNKILNKERAKSIVVRTAKILEIDLLSLAYENMGIFKYWNEEVSGELFVVNSFLKKYFQNKEELVFFDIGANIGNYSLMLNKAFPDSCIYAFEPNPNTFKILSQKINNSKIKQYRLGFGSSNCEQIIYTYSNDLASGHASLYKDVLIKLHRADEVLEIEFEIVTIDDFCKTNKIDCIDFIKIDTEGHEFEVLMGASNMLSNGKIDIIQFEFNEMNVISRVFLKDFYDILSDYSIYRIDSNKLIPLPRYQSRNEIFQFQNFLAVRDQNT